MGEKLLNEYEAAELLGMSVSWMRNKRVSGGGVPFMKLADGKGPVRYERSIVEAFKQSRVRRSTSE